MDHLYPNCLYRLAVLFEMSLMADHSFTHAFLCLLAASEAHSFGHQSRCLYPQLGFPIMLP